MTFATRIVARNLVLSERDKERIQYKVAKLNKLLSRFPANSVDLQVAVERLKRRGNEIIVSLTLRIPSDVLYCQKRASQLSVVMDEAVRTMEREVQKHKAHLRGAAAWKRRTRRERQFALSRPMPEPEPMLDEQSDQLKSMISRLLRDNYERLLNYINNKLADMEASNQVAPGVLNPQVILETVAIICLRHPRRKPATMSYMVWFYALAGRELSVAARSERRKNRKEISLDELTESDSNAERGSGYDAEQPMDMIEHIFEPKSSELGELTPDLSVQQPDFQAARVDLFAAVRSLAEHWPELEREAFELHFIEGLESFEIAVLKSIPVSRVEQAIDAINQSLREIFFATAEHRQAGIEHMDMNRIMAAIENAAAKKDQPN